MDGSPDRIEVYCDSHGVSYCSTRERLINAGLATSAMFPGRNETWRGNGPCRDPDEPLWSVQRAKRGRYKVIWGLCLARETD
jgi:hypothetical protein